MVRTRGRLRVALAGGHLVARPGCSGRGIAGYAHQDRRVRLGACQAILTIMEPSERAWERANDARERLAAWLHTGAEGDALGALEDISTLRRALDQAELAAVRAARGDGKSWAEIATMLGITRQSAWERWRDLDPDSGPTGAVSRAAAAMRRRAQVNVPNVIGLSWVDALDRLHRASLVAVGPDPDVRPSERSSRPRRHRPESGVRCCGPARHLGHAVDRATWRVRSTRAPAPETAAGGGAAAARRADQRGRRLIDRKLAMSAPLHPADQHDNR